MKLFFDGTLTTARHLLTLLILSASFCRYPVSSVIIRSHVLCSDPTSTHTSAATLVVSTDARSRG
jgi:hypothetical protein